MNIRAFEPDDAEKIARLFTLHTPYRRDAAFWVWLNRTLPARPSLVAVAEMAGDIVGHYAIVPLDLRRPDGRIVAAGLGVHAFVSPTARREVSIFQVSALAYRLAREAGLEFIFGFPNANYRVVQEKIERWRGVGFFKAWTKSAVTGPTSLARARLGLADFSDDAELHSAMRLWERLDAAPGGLRVVGQSRWWMLRYVTHPQQPYSIWWVLVDGEKHGLVVAKKFTGDGERRAHLIDYALSAEVTLADLLGAFETTFFHEVDRFVHWPVEPAFELALRAGHYAADGFETYFGVRRIAAGEPASGAVADELDFSSWRLPMGLSDAF